MNKKHSLLTLLATVSITALTPYTGNNANAAEATCCASSGGGTTQTGDAASVAPKMPSNPTSVAPSATQVKLSWIDSNYGTAKYRIYRNGNFEPMAEITGSVFTDLTVSANTAYSYQIRAVDSRNASNVSGMTTFPSVITPSAQSTWIFNSDFENNSISGWSTETAAVPYAAQFVTSPFPVRSGTKAMRFELRRNDPDVAGSRRAELSRFGMVQNGEYWYAFSVFLPTDYALDRSPEVLAQWHNYPDFNLGETWMSPPLTLRTSAGRWAISRLWDDAAISSNLSVGAKGNIRVHDLGVYDSDKGRWTNWVFRVKWGWLASQNPKLEVYKNGVLVLNQNGLPNTTNDSTAPYFKIGIYKWDWKEDPQRSDTHGRVVYFDRVAIGNSNSTLRDMQ